MEQIVVDKKACPICNRATIQAKAISETGDAKDAGLWYYCSCGVIFNGDVPNPDPLDKEYIKLYEEKKEGELVFIQPARVYSPLIEELTIGRKLLDVGFCVPYNMKFFQERGWVTFGVDNNKDIEITDRIFNEDFESNDRIHNDTYDCVWMSHVLEKFKDPLAALLKAREILTSTGVLYIATPDIDFLYSKPAGEWTHWDRKGNNVLWSTRSLKRELERIGFEVVMCRRNYYSRFGFYHNIHLIAQKIYF